MYNSSNSKNYILTKNKTNQKTLKENNSFFVETEKRINNRYIHFPSPMLTKKYNYNALQTMENSNPKTFKNQNMYKKRKNNNNSNNRNINKVFSNFKETLLNSKNVIRANTENYLH